MIYLASTTEAQSLMIPRNGEGVSGTLSLVVRNTTDHQGHSFSVVDLNTSGLYFNLALTLPEGIAKGEYHYALMNGEELLSCGLLFVGDFAGYHQHNEVITYNQYGAE